MDFYKLSSALITCMLFVVIDVHVEGIEIEKELRLSSLEKQKLEKVCIYSSILSKFYTHYSYYSEIYL